MKKRSNIKPIMPTELAIQLRNLGRNYNIRKGSGTDIDARRVANVTWELLLCYSWNREKLEFHDDLITSIERDTRKFGRPEYSIYVLAKRWKLQCSSLPIEDNRKGSTIDQLKLINVDEFPVEEIPKFFDEILKLVIGESNEENNKIRSNISRIRSRNPIRSIRGNARSLKEKR
ncbi:MAG: hypothetical protein IIB94_08030 [Candidatus Marinimicrobia bacterium]|nr:hypothetical protein [Candidatus Neomarinimicrobiota bacterium]